MKTHVNFGSFLPKDGCKSDRSRQELSKYLFAKIGVDTAENEPLKVHLIFKLWDLIFTEPSRPTGGSGAQRAGRGRVLGLCEKLARWFGRSRNVLNDECLLAKIGADPADTWKVTPFGQHLATGCQSSGCLRRRGGESPRGRTTVSFM